MRIANVIEEGKLGGPQVRMVRVATALREHAETLIVMPQANSGPFREMCKAHGVSYRVLPLTRITKEWRVALAYLLCSPFEVLRLARLFRREGIDLVHASGGSWQYKAVIAARLAGIPSVWHLNDTSMPDWVRKLFQLMQPLASGFIFASHRSRDYYGDRLTESIQAVVPSTVDVTRFDPDQSYPGEEELLAKLGDATVIGTVANINRIKGLETLIRAFAHAREALTELRLVVVGPIYANQAAYHRELCALADKLGVGEAIEWAGGRQDVRPLLARFDVYVCSSLAESSPVSVWEAMAMGKPVVSTDVGDVSRHLVHGKSGWIAPVGDYVALADGVRQLVANPELAAQFGEQARVEVEQQFSPPVIAEKTAVLYQRILAEKRGPAVAER